MNDLANFDPIEAKRQAKAEIEGYRERVRLERAAEERADETAAEEIAREVHQRRQAEAEEAAIRAERQRIHALREIELERQRRAEREQKVAADPRLRIAETPAKRLAIKLRTALGAEFADFLAELRTTNLQSLIVALKRVEEDVRIEAAARERAARAAAVEVPKPQNEHERLILVKHKLDA